MKSFTTLKKTQIDSLALGGFDGVHIAHQKLLGYLGKRGAMLSIYRDTKALTPKERRCKYVNCGCFLVLLDDIKDMSAKEFVEFLSKEFKNLKKIVIGYDFHFGKGRSADYNTLKKLFKGEVVLVDEIKIENISVHSKKIKELLKSADIKMANRLLGREYCIKGSVIKGQGIGKKELVATLNIDCSDYFLPKFGVYVTHSIIEGRSYNSVTFIGERKSTDGNFSIETHLLDEKIENSVSNLQICFVSFLRENRKFDDLEFLKKQIQKDIKEAKLLLQ